MQSQAQYRLRRREVLLASSLTPVMTALPHVALAQGSAKDEWRRSPRTLAEEIPKYLRGGDGRVPAAPWNFMTKGGEVPPTWTVMKDYAGDVEWEGQFAGFDEKGTLEGRPKKIDIKGIPLRIHVYTTAASLSKWEALAAGSAVRFRGTVEGIAAFAPEGLDAGKFIMVIVSLKNATLLSSK